MFYLSTPPAVFPLILEKLHQHKLIECAVQRPGVVGCRVIVEKPFGRDLASARALNEMIGSYLDESQIYRIDHYLGKETVQNILVLRFGNSIFEPIWNRNHIDYVEITAAEEIGIEGRGAFYEQTGVVRDIIQNHLLQVMSLVTMEVPASFRADDVRDEKSQVLRSMRELTLNDVANYAVRGQYRGYREEKGVAENIQAPTYAAMRFMIDSWRWQGVPFYLRAGKKLARAPHRGLDPLHARCRWSCSRRRPRARCSSRRCSRCASSPRKASRCGSSRRSPARTSRSATCS